MDDPDHKPDSEDPNGAGEPSDGQSHEQPPGSPTADVILKILLGLVVAFIAFVTLIFGACFFSF